MIIAGIGLLLRFLAIASGFGSLSYSRAAAFVGPLGLLFNLVELAIGDGLMFLGLAIYF